MCFIQKSQTILFLEILSFSVQNIDLILAKFAPKLLYMMSYILKCVLLCCLTYVPEKIIGKVLKIVIESIDFESICVEIGLTVPPR